jgi:hypothetical protein
MHDLDKHNDLDHRARAYPTYLPHRAASPLCEHPSGWADCPVVAVRWALRGGMWTRALVRVGTQCGALPGHMLPRRTHVGVGGVCRSSDLMCARLTCRADPEQSVYNTLASTCSCDSTALSARWLLR